METKTNLRRPYIASEQAFKHAIRLKLEYLRGELRAERISYGELTELRAFVDYIEPHDVELLEAAGVPEETYRKNLTKGKK